jgi:formylglycine-generating enzyme required for sulfatase activity
LREAQRLFEQEAVRLDDLGKHPQIPALLAHCEQEGRQYLVQEYIDGDNLLQELNKQGKFSEAKIKGLLLDLLPVLQFVHVGKVIHRDIKPENVIRRRSDGKLVLVDFGAAKVASRTALAKTGTTIGSAEYTAPEQARGKAVFASDLYALGVTCIHLLTQISPFDLFSDHEDQWVWRDFLNGNFVSNGLGVEIDKMLEMGLARRYQTAAEMLVLLQPQGISTTSIQASTAKIVIPQQSQPKVIGQVSEFEFEYVKTRLVSGGSLGTKNTVELDRKRGKAQYMRENLGNGVTIDLVRIHAGKFIMGSNESRDEHPIHEVFVPEFWMGKYAVTQKQWQSVMGNNPSDFKGGDLPVQSVSWHEARDFCAKVSKTTGKLMRLPTEAEWEYACRADTNTPFTFGEIISPELVNYDGNRLYGNAPKVVDAFYPNEWGLYQMHGNVWEWCLDEWHDTYSAKPSDLKKNGNRAWGDIDINENDNCSRLLRGGSWNSFWICRSSYRLWRYARIQLNGNGFRVALAFPS